MPVPKSENIAAFVHAVRGERVLFDVDLAALYGVSTGALNQAVKRNRNRFPADFMFQLTDKEWAAMRSQSVTASSSPATMSQVVTSSRRNLEVNIAIMRTFVQLRRLMDSNRQLARKIEALEERYDEQFAVVFDAIKRLIAEDDVRKALPKRQIGFVS